MMSGTSNLAYPASINLNRGSTEIILELNIKVFLLSTKKNKIHCLCSLYNSCMVQSFPPGYAYQRTRTPLVEQLQDACDVEKEEVVSGKYTDDMIEDDVAYVGLISGLEGRRPDQA